MRAASTALAIAVVLAGPAVGRAAAQIPPSSFPGNPPILSTVPSPSEGAELVPAQMSGLPLQVGDLPPGIVTVRVIRGSFSNNLANQRVSLHVDESGQIRQATTDASGRAQFDGLQVGARVVAEVSVDGERLESQVIQLPSEGGVRLMLVAGVGAGNPTPAATVGVAESAPLPVRTATASGALTQTEALVIVFGFFAIAAGTIHVAVRRPASERSAAGFASSPSYGRRSQVLELLVSLERERRAGSIAEDEYDTRRAELVSELLAIGTTPKWSLVLRSWSLGPWFVNEP